jgi:uncharacterized protein YcnI
MKEIMKAQVNFIFKTVAICAMQLVATAATAHVVLEEPKAVAGRSYKAVLRVGHGCEGSATTGIKVLIPADFQGAKPMPKVGWTLTTTMTKLAKPYDSHGRTVTEDVSEISWSANSKDNWLPDAWYDEFVLRGNLPRQAGPMWFKVLQTCEKGQNDWSQVPTSGISTKGLKSPAVLLEITDSAASGHQH